MDDVVKVAGWLIAGAVAVHLLTNSTSVTGIGAVFNGFSNLIASMLGNAPTASAGGGAPASQLGMITTGQRIA
jgi:hypothetical protein